MAIEIVIYLKLDSIIFFRKQKGRWGFSGVVEFEVSYQNGLATLIKTELQALLILDELSRPAAAQ